MIPAVLIKLFTMRGSFIVRYLGMMIGREIPGLVKAMWSPLVLACTNPSSSAIFFNVFQLTGVSLLATACSEKADRDSHVFAENPCLFLALF